MIALALWSPVFNLHKILTECRGAFLVPQAISIHARALAESCLNKPLCWMTVATAVDAFDNMTLAPSGPISCPGIKVIALTLCNCFPLTHVLTTQCVLQMMRMKICSFVWDCCGEGMQPILTMKQIVKHNHNYVFSDRFANCENCAFDLETIKLSCWQNMIIFFW